MPNPLIDNGYRVETLSCTKGRLQSGRAESSSFSAEEEASTQPQSFMNVQCLNNRCLWVCAGKCGRTGEMLVRKGQGVAKTIVLKRRRNHWIDLREFSFLFYLLLP